MLGIIDNYDFGEMDCMKYYAPPSSWTEEKKKATARERIFSGDWYAAEKMDGFFGKLVKDEDGNILLYSRSRGVNGEYANKKDWVPQLNSFFEELPSGTCLLGELYLPTKPGSKNVQTILGCLKEKAIDRQNSGEKINFYVFDCLAYNGISYMKKSYEFRTEAVKNINTTNQYVRIAKYYNGIELWNQLQLILARGGEGMVIMYKDGLYEPGKRPSKTTLKVKKELENAIDCFFTGKTMAPTKLYTGKEIENWQYWYNEKSGEYLQGTLYRDSTLDGCLTPVTKNFFNHWAGSLEIGVFDEKENIIPIGWLSGITEDMRANPKNYAFKPMEVTAMEMDYSNTVPTLRHGKIKCWREDLDLKKDCLLSKLYE